MCCFSGDHLEYSFTDRWIGIVVIQTSEAIVWKFHVVIRVRLALHAPEKYIYIAGLQGMVLVRAWNRFLSLLK